MNPDKEYSCCNGHQFNQEEVKHEWKGRAVCPTCHPFGYKDSPECNRSVEAMIEKITPDIPKDIRIGFPENDKRDQGCPECHPENAKLEGATYHLCARHYNEYMIAKDFPKPIEGVFISKDTMDSVKELLKIQKMEGNWNYDPYMHGMANGMILLSALLEGKEPEFLEAPSIWVKDYPKNES